MQIYLERQLPEYPSFVAGIRRAPDRGCTLTQTETCEVFNQNNEDQYQSGTGNKNNEIKHERR